MNWQHLLFFVGGALLLWMCYRGVKNNPGAFSGKNLSKSFATLGVLALLLIGFIWFLVLMLKS